jgi:hypothetical protein
MANTVIALRSSGVTGNTPSLGVLANGELSLNFADGILYYKSSSNTLGSIRTTAVSGLTTEVQFNDAGSFGANANFTFNKTLATLNVKNINVSTNLTTVNLTATSITTGTGVGGIIAGANVIYSNVFVANSGGYIQFGDGTKQYTANAGSGSGIDTFARNQANAAFSAANTAQSTATSASDTAISAASDASFAISTACTALATATASFIKANAAFDKANTGGGSASFGDYFPIDDYGNLNDSTTTVFGESLLVTYDCRNEPITPNGYFLTKDFGYLT